MSRRFQFNQKSSDLLSCVGMAELIQVIELFLRWKSYLYTLSQDHWFASQYAT